MTERRPAGQSFETWIDRQVREAEERGAFDDLPGRGRPLPDRSAESWIVEYARREQLPTSAMLPPALALAREVEDLPDVLAGVRSEVQVRRILTDLNDRIRAAHRSYAGGPPVLVRTLDVEALVRDWRRSR